MTNTISTMFFVLLMMSAFAASATSPTADPDPSLIQVESGLLKGKRTGAVTAFLGIPYAASPTGDRRWRAPQPTKLWTGIRKAVHFGANCQQDLVPGSDGVGPWRHEYLASGQFSENCLFLNIWTPSHAPSEKLPVLFWIHGGAFIQGSGSVPIYDGAPLASQSVIVVSINYRLGIYGFLAHPQLAAKGSGNYGLRDQIAALAWVHRNIDRFGGDAERVTIAGQSAGAASVHHLIASSLAKGMFHQAIAESGSGMGLSVLSESEAESQGAEFVKAAGAVSIAKLRRLSVVQLREALIKFHDGRPMALMEFAPYRDGTVVPAASAVAMTSGTYNDTPLLTGLNNDELSGMDPQYGRRSSSEYSAELSRRYGTFAARFASLYPIDQPEASEPLLNRDRGIAAMLLWAEERRRSSHFPLFAYLFVHTEPGPGSERFRSFHSSEIPYVFDTLSKSRERPYTQADKMIAQTMGKYWVAYIKTGNPNVPGLPVWPQLDSQDQIMQLGDRFLAVPALDPQKMANFRAYVHEGGTLSLF